MFSNFNSKLKLGIETNKGKKAPQIISASSLQNFACKTSEKTFE